MALVTPTWTGCSSVAGKTPCYNWTKQYILDGRGGQVSVKQVVILMRRRGSLLLWPLVLGVTFTVTNGHAANALVGVDPRELLQTLSPGNLLAPEKTGKSNA